MLHLKVCLRVPVNTSLGQRDQVGCANLEHVWDVDHGGPAMAGKAGREFFVTVFALKIVEAGVTADE